MNTGVIDSARRSARLVPSPFASPLWDSRDARNVFEPRPDWRTAIARLGGLAGLSSQVNPAVMIHDKTRLHSARPSLGIHGLTLRWQGMRRARATCIIRRLNPGGGSPRRIGPLLGWCV